jgi:hypothetical protein
MIRSCVGLVLVAFSVQASSFAGGQRSTVNEWQTHTVQQAALMFRTPGRLLLVQPKMTPFDAWLKPVRSFSGHLRDPFTTYAIHVSGDMEPTLSDTMVRSALENHLKESRTRDGFIKGGFFPKGVKGADSHWIGVDIERQGDGSVVTTVVGHVRAHGKKVGLGVHIEYDASSVGAFSIVMGILESFRVIDVDVPDVASTSEGVRQMWNGCNALDSF